VVEDRIPTSHSAPFARNALRAIVTAEAAVLRTGPGVEYRKIGRATTEMAFPVTGTQDGWIEIEIGKLSSGNVRTAWIRADLAKVQAETQAESRGEAQQ
jgi:hypothetical protein